MTAGFIHGRLHPSKILVTTDATYVIGAPVRQSIEGDGRRWPVLQPYTAPEVVGGARPAPTSDQFSLAAIAYEWMFGRPIAGPADRSLDVRALPNIDRSALSKAFTRALTREAFRRFASCTDFCDAVAASLAPSLPLTPPHHAGERVAGAPLAADDEEDPFEPFQPEQPAAVAPIVVAEAEPDLSFTPEESNVTAPELNPDAIHLPPAKPTTDAVLAWRSDMATEPVTATRSDRARFSGLALILATLVGAGLGFAAGYMARPRALQSGPPTAMASAGADNALKEKAPAPAPGTSEAGKAPTPAPKAPAAPAAPAKIGRLLVRSTPSGASVEVDGVGARCHAIGSSRPGSRRPRNHGVAAWLPSGRTAHRADQSAPVALASKCGLSQTASRLAAAPPGRPTPASLGQTSHGRPARWRSNRARIGAAVTVNGKPSGTTPVTLDELRARRVSRDDHAAGLSAFATTVRVVAGERARAAASVDRTGAGMNAILALEDGTWFQGVSAGAPGRHRAAKWCSTPA